MLSTPAELARRALEAAPGAMIIIDALGIMTATTASSPRRSVT